MHLISYSAVKTLNLAEHRIDKLYAGGEVEENGGDGNPRFFSNFRMAGFSQPATGEHA